MAFWERLQENSIKVVILEQNVNRHVTIYQADRKKGEGKGEDSRQSKHKGREL